MKPSDIYFSIHSILEIDGEHYTEKDLKEYQGMYIITFCPVSYWEERKCLPDYYWTDTMEKDIPLAEGYKWYLFTEETQWCSKKSRDEISADLISLGFLENKLMEYFLRSCWR